jgi:hypothetical protein
MSAGTSASDLEGLVERILSRCIRTEGGCLEWQGASAKAKGGQPGHGRIKHKGKLLLPHRVVLEHSLGEALPRHILACHECDNPPCCEATHLFPGTYADNARDAASKGRMKVPRNGAAVTASNKRRWAKWREERGLPAEATLKPLVKVAPKTSKRMVKWDGQLLTCAELARRVGLSRQEVSRLARKGWFATNDNAIREKQEAADKEWEAVS